MTRRSGWTQTLPTPIEIAEMPLRHRGRTKKLMLILGKRRRSGLAINLKRIASLAVWGGICSRVSRPGHLYSSRLLLCSTIVKSSPDLGPLAAGAFRKADALLHRPASIHTETKSQRSGQMGRAQVRLRGGIPGVDKRRQNESAEFSRVAGG